MTLMDVNAIVRTYLLDAVANPAYVTLNALVGTRVYSPRLPEKSALPAISYFIRGGTSTPYIPDLPAPSVQFDCWAEDVEVAGVITERGAIKAREVYRTLYDSWQGIQNITIRVPPVTGVDYVILSAREEVQGMDLVDDIPGYFRVLTFFEIKVK